MTYKFPETREDITLWALEHSPRFDWEITGCNIVVANDQICDWVKFVLSRYPELVTLDFSSGNCDRVLVANVVVAGGVVPTERVISDIVDLDVTVNVVGDNDRYKSLCKFIQESRSSLE